MKRISFVTLFLAIVSCVCVSASDESTETAIFSNSIRSLKIEMEGDRLALPVLTLGGEERLIIGFDDLADERQYLRYSIYHCDMNWQPSDLVDSEVFDGFNFADINDFAYSRATTTHYIHYSITLPNADFSFNISGNYLLKVYPEDEPEDLLLQVRFAVQEGNVIVGGTVSPNTDIDYNDEHQQLTLKADLRNLSVRDPNSEIVLVVDQNNRPDTRRVVYHPSRIAGYQLVYEYNPTLIFPAGNEYRRMETINNLYPGMGTDHIEFHAPYYYHILNLDKPRAHHQYLYDQTQHGRYFIREYNAENSDIEADYVLTMFTLDMLQIPDVEVYLDGDFTLRQKDDRSRMDYNPSTGRYEKLLLLKQGAYNYQYLVAGKSADESNQIEGDKYQTSNEYHVYIYYRPAGSRYDRLLRVATLL